VGNEDPIRKEKGWFPVPSTKRVGMKKMVRKQGSARRGGKINRPGKKCRSVDRAAEEGKGDRAG